MSLDMVVEGRILMLMLIFILMLIHFRFADTQGEVQFEVGVGG